MSSDEQQSSDAEREAVDEVVIEPVAEQAPQPPHPHPAGATHAATSSSRPGYVPARTAGGSPRPDSPAPRPATFPPPYRPPQPETVELEAVAARTRPHPLRFGIKAMFGITLLCAVQFALISYVGTLLGVVLGAAACLVVIACLVVAAMVYRPEGESRAMDYMDQLAIRLTLAVVILFLGFIVAGGGTFAWSEIVKLRRNALLESELGFSARRDRVFGNAGFQNVLVIQSVAPGKPFDKAGIRKDDAILLKDETDLYEILDSNRGSQVTLEVASGTSKSVSSLGKTRAVTVSIPAPPTQP